ncbi:hypothetical protein HKBW3S33_00931, partial [Candidatus Hakubella thermalkaliphila]
LIEPQHIVGIQVNDVVGLTLDTGQRLRFGYHQSN